MVKTWLYYVRFTKQQQQHCHNYVTSLPITKQSVLKLKAYVLLFQHEVIIKFTNTNASNAEGILEHQTLHRKQVRFLHVLNNGDNSFTLFC